MGSAQSRRLRVLALASIPLIGFKLIGFSFVGPVYGEVSAVQPDTYKVEETEIVDFKSVFATVRSRDQISARVRTPGTIIKLDVDEGDLVKAGQMIATVVDDKIAIRLKGVDAQIAAAKNVLITAQSDLDRAKELTRRGISPKTRLEQAQNIFETAESGLKALVAERSVAIAQQKEGQVLAPADGTVLKVPVTLGSVVLPGEAIATIAANAYLLRLALPERHALFMRSGDEVRVGARGSAGESMSDDVRATVSGKISQVYPELQDGRVVADAEVDGLEGYFIGERALAWISAGKRKTMLVPKKYIFQRFSLDYVKLAQKEGTPIDVVVQLGREQRKDGDDVLIEVLSGLQSNDMLVAP